MRTLSVAVVPISMLLLGCSGVFASYRGDLRAICDTPMTCATCTAATPEALDAQRFGHLAGAVGSVDGHALVAALREAEPRKRIQALEFEAKANGIEACDLVDTWRDERTKAFQAGLTTVCKLHDSCADFARATPTSVITCAKAAGVHADVVDELENMDTRNGIGFAKHLTQLTSQYEMQDCPLVLELRKGP